MVTHLHTVAPASTGSPLELLPSLPQSGAVCRSSSVFQFTLALRSPLLTRSWGEATPKRLQGRQPPLLHKVANHRNDRQNNTFTRSMPRMRYRLAHLRMHPLTCRGLDAYAVT